MVASIDSSTATPLAVVGLRAAKQEQQAILGVVSNALQNAQQIQQSGAKGQTSPGVGGKVDVSA